MFALFSCVHLRRDLFRKRRRSQNGVKTEGPWQPANIAKVKKNRSGILVNTEVARVHVGLSEHQRFVGEGDIYDGVGSGVRPILYVDGLARIQGAGGYPRRVNYGQVYINQRETNPIEEPLQSADIFDPRGRGVILEEKVVGTA